MPSSFIENEVKSNLKNKRLLSNQINEIFATEINKKCSLNYIFCDDDYLLEINKKFLQHDTFTDIITFDLSENSNKVEGEIYISIDRIKENATNFEVDFNTELHRVIFHGALHLCGYKDKLKEDKEKMNEMENKYLQLYFQ